MQASSSTMQDVESNPRKKRRLPGSCDNCKTRKVKCDSSKTAGNRCTNCVNTDLDCTHELLTKNLRSAKGYAEQLEERLAKMQRLLNRVMPDVDIERELEKDSGFEEHDEIIQAPEPPLQRNDDDKALDQLSFKFRTLALDPATRRYQGKSSQLYLLQSILNHRLHFLQRSTGAPFPWLKRNEFWNPQPWPRRSVSDTDPLPAYEFPSKDLMEELVENYFVNMNFYQPLLHRPTFEAGLKTNLHRNDQGFASVALLVCALGARFSNDPRVFLPNVEFARQSAGWRWFEQVPALRQSNFDERATLYELQSCVLNVIYNSAASSAPGMWVHIGLGLRMAMDVGAHRRRTGTDSQPLTVEDELWKRVFWLLLTYDVAKSSIEGLPCTVYREDYDLDYPTELEGDDLLSVSAWTSFIKLRAEIQADILRTIYPTRKPVRHDANIPDLSELQAIANLDSALNKWLSDDLSPALRMDAEAQSKSARILSLFLYVAFYGTQILLHKPYVPSLNVNGQQSSISYTMCLNASRKAKIPLIEQSSHLPIHRAIARIIESPILKESQESGPYPLFKRSAFSAGLILITASWGVQHTSWTKGSQSDGAANRLQSDLKHVQSCLDFLKASEERYNTAGKLWDLLSQVVIIGNMPMVSEANSTTKKRGLDEEEIIGTAPSGPTNFDFNVPSDLHQDLLPQFTDEDLSQPVLQDWPSGFDQTLDDSWTTSWLTDNDRTASLLFNPPSSYELDDWVTYFEALTAQTGSESG